MNQKNIVIAAILAAALLAGIFSATPPMAVYAEDDYDDDEHDDDEKDYDRDHDDRKGKDHDRDGYKGGDSSETNTENKIKQNNVGSGSSTNVQCAENSMDGGFIDAQVCGTLDLGLGGMIEVVQGAPGVPPAATP